MCICDVYVSCVSVYVRHVCVVYMLYVFVMYVCIVCICVYVMYMCCFVYACVRYDLGIERQEEAGS